MVDVAGLAAEEGGIDDVVVVKCEQVAVADSQLLVEFLTLIGD